MTGKPKPLSEHQRAALKRAKKGKVFVSGRGCKATIDGLAHRDLIDRPHLDFTYSPGCRYRANLTPWGEQVAEALRNEGKAP